MISVVIPTRHRNDALAACLERLAPGVQTLQGDRCEVIVTDDGSGTTAQEMIRDRFPWARWTAGPRRGPAANRNHGASLATGQWLAFTDDDCVPSPGWLAAYSDAIDSKTLVYEGKTTCAAGLKSIWEEAPINLQGGNLWSCNMMIAKEIFHALGEFDARFPHAAVEDIEFHNRVRRSGYGIQFVPEAVVDHPPRPRKVGAAAADLWEGRVLMHILEPQSLPDWLPLHVLKLRLKQAFALGFAGGSLRFGGAAAVEVFLVALRHKRWRLKHAGAQVIPSPAKALSV